MYLSLKLKLSLVAQITLTKALLRDTLYFNLKKKKGGSSNSKSNLQVSFCFFSDRKATCDVYKASLLDHFIIPPVSFHFITCCTDTLAWKYR